MKKEYKISKENAKEQLDLFLDWYNVDFEDRAEAFDVSQDDLYQSFYPILRAIRQGALEITVGPHKDGGDTLSVTQRLFSPIGAMTEIKYAEVTARARVSVKGGDNISDTAKTYQFLGVLSGEGPEVLYKLRGADVSVLDALGMLFLAV